MIRQIALVVITVVALSSCGSKKQTTYKNSQNQFDRNTDAGMLSAPEIRALPADTGNFVQFQIANTGEYINTFAAIAQEEMRIYGIPASITLAQGILESGSGKGKLTLKTNNHFGIKCHVGWDGDFDFHDDDTQGECFRKYNHPLHSFRDHSIFLTSRSRYAFLFNYRKGDYKKWAHGLQKAGYATDRKYSQKLISIIERYRLNMYDREVLRNQTHRKQKRKKHIQLAHVVQKGDTLYAISKRYALSVEALMKLNKLNDTNIMVGQILKIRTEQPR